MAGRGVLLNRTTRQVTLTDAGSVYYARAKRLLDDLADADSRVSDRGDEPSGPLRVSVPVSYGVRCLAPHVAAFLARYPKVGVDMQLTDERADLVVDRIDVAIRLGDAAPTADVIARPLGEFRRYVVAGPGYLHAHGTPSAPQDLTDHACLRFDFGVDQQVWTFAGERTATKTIATGRLKSNHIEVLHSAALDGAGIARLPDWLVDTDIRSGRLQQLFGQFEVTPDATRPVVTALYLPSQRGSKRVSAFVEFVSTLIGATP